MKHPWEAECAIQSPLALRLIQEQFPELDAHTIRDEGSGWDNTAFLVNGLFLFRFPRRESAVVLLEAEWQLLGQLAPLLPLPIPRPQYKGTPTPSFPWPFIGYPFLPGATACHAALSDEERYALAQPLGQFLSSLHAIDPTRIQGHKTTPEDLQRISPQALAPKIEKGLQELDELHLSCDVPLLRKVLATQIGIEEPQASCIVHGDFYARHLLLNSLKQLCGVIDWGDVHVGDPAIDLAVAHSFLPHSAHTLFCKSYGPITEPSWQRAFLRALMSAVYITLFGHHTNQQALKHEGLSSLARLQRGFYPPCNS